MSNKRYKDSVRPGSPAEMALRYSHERSAYIDKMNAMKNNPYNNNDKRFFDIGLKAAAGQLCVKDVPDVILNKYFTFLGKSPNPDRKILLKEIPDEVKNHISFIKGVENWNRQLEGEKAREEAKNAPFYQYDRGFMFYVNGVERNRINSNDLNNPEFMQGYTDAEALYLIQGNEIPFSYEQGSSVAKTTSRR